jgi:hypothetical protein
VLSVARSASEYSEISPSWQQGKLTLVDSKNIVRLSGPAIDSLMDSEEQKHEKSR